MSAAPVQLNPAGESLDTRRLGIVPALFLGTGLAGLAASAVGGFMAPGQFAFSWLFAFLYCFTLCAGSLFWIILHHAINASWSALVRRILENVAVLAVALVVAFVPVALLAPEIFKWMTLPPGADALLDHKAVFLNKAGFYARAVFYFAFFVVAAWVLRMGSVAQDKDGDPRLSLRMRRLCNGFLILFAVCCTGAGIDWMMALDHHWFSTMWGVYLFAGAGHAAMALLILAANGLVFTGHLKGLFTEEHNHIMGKLLFAFTVFWAYIAFSQYFLIYYGNIPEETWFFTHRNTGSWHYVALGLALGRFLIPFALLITQPAKKSPARVCFAAAWILGMHAVDLYWIIMPQKQVNAALKAGHEAAAAGFAPHWLDFTAWAGLVGILGFLFLRLLARASIYPARDPRIYESISLKN